MSPAPDDTSPDGPGRRSDSLTDSESSAEDLDEQWQFGLDDLDEERELGPALEPGSPSVENAFFVLVGIVGTLFVFATAL